MAVEEGLAVQNRPNENDEGLKKENRAARKTLVCWMARKNIKQGCLSLTQGKIDVLLELRSHSRFKAPAEEIRKTS